VKTSLGAALLPPVRRPPARRSVRSSLGAALLRPGRVPPARRSVRSSLGAALLRPGRVPPARRSVRPILGAALLPLALAPVGCAGGAAAGQDREVDDRVLTVQLTGHRYWWDVVYRGPGPHGYLRAANELHLPAGEPVRIEVRGEGGATRLWIAGLGPGGVLPWWGRSGTVRARRPGTHLGRPGDVWTFGRPPMELTVVVHEPQDFVAWRSRRQAAPQEPVDPWLRSGREVFLGYGCAFCHTVRGTGAWGFVAPDLTHFGSRATIGAGVVPNTRGHLAAWIADPRGVKPGNLMPAVPLPGNELRALIDYLESLR
jgi:cytochrome c oxidase subunit II